jgi:hypothetical protein
LAETELRDLLTLFDSHTGARVQRLDERRLQNPGGGHTPLGSEMATTTDHTIVGNRRTMDDQKALAMLREAIERKVPSRTSKSTDESRRKKSGE